MSNTMSVQEYLAMQGSGSKKKGSPEHDEQVKVFEWAEITSLKFPALKMLLAIPNGAFYGGHWSVANRMKAEGVKKGVPDIFLPVVRISIKPKGISGGLWIEMKAGKNKPSQEQKWWLEQLEKQGYVTRVCYSAEEAIEAIEDYLSFNQD
jgi:hypothetical protein